MDTRSVGPDNTEPVAIAIANQNADVGDIVELNGSLSYDQDCDSIDYDWSLSDKPSDSNAVLTRKDSAFSSFIPDLPGTYIVRLMRER